MQRFRRNLVISAVVMIFGLALYQARLLVTAAGSTAISSVTGFALTYTGTSYVPMVNFSGAGAVVSGDIIKAYLSTSSSSGSLGAYSVSDTLTSAHQYGPSPRTGTIDIGTGFENYTGDTLYIHVFVTDNAGANTGYAMQAITFVASGGGGMSHADWAALYTGTIYPAVLSGGINSNLDTVTAANVMNFQNLYFEAPGSGKLLLATGLDLEDSAVQDFLQHIPSYLHITNGFVSFNPTGSGANLNVNAQIFMYYSSGISIPSNIDDNINNIIIKDLSGNILASSGMISSFVCGLSGSYNICGFDTPHFTSFEMRPWLTAVHITSDNANPSYAKSGDTVTLSFTGSETLSGVTVTINGSATGVTLTGGGTTWIATKTLGAGDGITTFTIDFSNLSGGSLNLSGITVTGTTDSSSVTLDNTAPSATGSYSTTNPTNQDVTVTLTGWSETLTGVNAYSHVFTSNTGFTFTFLDLAGNTGSYTTTVTWIDKTAVTGTLAYSITGNTNQNVVASITFNKTGVTVTNNGGATGYTFTNTGTFTFTFQDAYGNTGNATATVTWIDKIAPTASVMYTNSGANVLASLTGASESITGTLTHLFTSNGSYTFTFFDLAGNTGTALATAVVSIAGDTTSSGATNIGGATTTGVTFTTTGTLTINATGSTNNSLTINVSGVVITTSGGTWDGVLNPPTDLSGGDSNKATIGEIGLTNTSTTTYTALLTIQAGATTDSLSISGGYFTISFVVAGGTNGDVLKLYRSTNGSVWTANTPDATCTLNSSLVCSFTTDHLSYFSTVKTTTSTSGGGGGGSSTQKDHCPGGDKSPSFYDGKCDALTGSTTGWQYLNLGAIMRSKYSDEFKNAYIFAHGMGITTMDTIEEANMEGMLKRAHMAKMMAVYAVKNMKLTPNTGTLCIFNDVAHQSTEMRYYITLACQLGLMGVNMTGFDPDGEVTRAQFGTVLSRALRGTAYNTTGLIYYSNHLNALKNNNIITNTNPFLKELRGYVMLMLMRATD